MHQYFVLLRLVTTSFQKNIKIEIDRQLDRKFALTLTLIDNNLECIWIVHGFLLYGDM